MKTLTNLHINSDQLCCSEKMSDSSGKKTEMKLSGRASFLDSDASNGYMSYRGSVDVELNQSEIEEISKVALKALERLASEVKKSGTDKD